MRRANPILVTMPVVLALAGACSSSRGTAPDAAGDAGQDGVRSDRSDAPADGGVADSAGGDAARDGVGSDRSDALTDGKAADGAGGDAGGDAASARPQLGDLDGKGRKLTWAEEFDGPQINRGVWGNETGLVRNNESQCYTTDAKNQFIENGELVIRAIHENQCGGTYTAASLTTEGKQSFRYGRLEARIKVPKAKGSWPAFWLLPANKAAYVVNGSWWPAGGEIDVMEWVSQDPTLSHGTAHYLQGGTHGMSGHYLVLPEPVSAAYHVFAIEWTATKIEWDVDGKKFHSFDITQPFDGRRPFNDFMYVILNYAIDGSWGETPDPAQYPSDMRVDWVRYWTSI